MTVVTIGLVLWVVTLGVTIAAHGRLSNHGHSDWVWIALAGVLLGLIGARHVRRRQSAQRAGHEADPTVGASAPNTP